MKRAMILSGAAYAAAAGAALAGSPAAAGAALALAQLPPLSQLAVLAGRRRDEEARERSGRMAVAARALARGETWRRSERVVSRARALASDPAEEAGVAWTIAEADERVGEGPVLWGIASSRAGAIAAFYATREAADRALREVTSQHPELDDGSRRVVQVLLGLAPLDRFHPVRAHGMEALPPRVLATSPGPNPFYLMQG